MKEQFPQLDDLPNEVSYRANAIVLNRYNNDSVGAARDYVGSFETAEERSKIAVGIFENVLRADSHSRVGSVLRTFLSAFPEQKPNIMASALNNLCKSKNSENVVSLALQGFVENKENPEDFDALVADLSHEGRGRFVKFLNNILRDDQANNNLSEQNKSCLSHVIRGIDPKQQAPQADILPFA